MPPVPRRILALLACTTLLLIVAAPVAAHAELVAATPADGAHLDVAPAEVVLNFSAELAPDGSGFTVTGPDGSEVGSGTVDLQVADRNVLRGAISATAEGAYSIAWTSVAADGHQEIGTLGFTVGTVGLADTALPAGPTPGAWLGWLLLALAAALAVRRARAR